METRNTSLLFLKFYWFKSYYVVWKRFHFFFVILFVILFKSYYVVWKLSLSSIFRRSSCCLNRTMQYGNLYKDLLCIFPQCCLNRTMQYGNHFKHSKQKHSQISLNRTMQYGNSQAVFTSLKTVFCLNRTMQYGNVF